MSIALPVLIALRIFRLKNSIELEKKLFEYDVYEAMQSAVKIEQDSHFWCIK